MTQHATHRDTNNNGGYMWVVVSLVFAVAVIGGALLWVNQHRGSPANAAAPSAGGSSAVATGNLAEASSAASGVVERSDRVESLQRELTKVGVYSGTIDGVYGPATQASLTKLQAQLGVPRTGLFDQSTWKAAAAKGRLKTSQTVMSLQLALKTLGQFDGAITGKYDVATELAIRAFQRSRGMTPDGVWSPTLDATIESALDSAN